MSNFESDVEVQVGAGDASLAGLVEVLTPREVLLGPRQEVRRVLPNKSRRLIGAWCFVDHYGPEDIARGPGMRVPPHPHTGLQTVSWLLAGEVHHRDSLGSDAVIVPGQLNLMTSGPGIAHSEASPADHSSMLHGLQLWVALPDSVRSDQVRSFEQYANLPVVERSGLRAVVVVGEFEGARSPALAYTPLVGVELEVTGSVEVELDPAHEYGVLAIDEGIQVEGVRLELSEIGYVGDRRSSLRLSSARDGEPSRAFLLGGEPFEEELVMWWNFIGRTHEEIEEFRRIWNAEAAEYGTGALDGGQFGEVFGFDGGPLPAPPMPNTRLKSRGRHR